MVMLYPMKIDVIVCILVGFSSNCFLRRIKCSVAYDLLFATQRKK